MIILVLYLEKQIDELKQILATMEVCNSSDMSILEKGRSNVIKEIKETLDAIDDVCNTDINEQYPF